MPAICGARSCKAKACIEAGDSTTRTGAREGAVGLPPLPHWHGQPPQAWRGLDGRDLPGATGRQNR